MADTSFSLPSRQLRAAPGSFTHPRGLVIAILLALAGSIGVFIWQGADLYRDFIINQNPQPLVNSSMRNAECSTRRMFTTCSADVSYQYEGQNYASHIRLAFFSASRGDFRVNTVISRDHPEMATLSLGLERLTNRLITFGIAQLLMLGLAFYSLSNILRGRRGNREWAEPTSMRAVPLAITNMNRAKNGRSWVSYRALRDGKQVGPVLTTRFEPNQQPLMELDARVEAQAVGAQIEGSKLPLMLDGGLERLDLTASERDTALNWGRTPQRGAAMESSAARAAQSEPLTYAEPSKRGGGVRRLLLLALIVIGGIGGYWYWYVTADTSRAALGQQINAYMPQPLRQWGCEQLSNRFPQGTRFEGCSAGAAGAWTPPAK